MEISSRRYLVLYHYLTFYSVNEFGVMNPRVRTAGKPNFGNQGLLGGLSWAPSTVYDKGLMDAREVGYLF